MTPGRRVLPDTTRQHVLPLVLAIYPIAHRLGIRDLNATSTQEEAIPIASYWPRSGQVGA